MCVCVRHEIIRARAVYASDLFVPCDLIGSTLFREVVCRRRLRERERKRGKDREERRVRERERERKEEREERGERREERGERG